MRGIADDLRATIAHVLRGDVSESYARGQVDRGEEWLAGLGPRRDSPGFAEEVTEVTDAIDDLWSAIRRRFAPGKVRLLWVPERTSKTQKVMRRDATIANVFALRHAQLAGLDPGDVGLIQPERPKRPSIEVLRLDQGWVWRRGRARVETAYELLISDKHVLMGSRRYVMRQAHWGAMCDAFGQLPELERLTGLAKRRALYKARKAKRLRRRVRRAYRLAKRALVNHDRAHWPATHTNFNTGVRKTIYLDGR